MKQLQFWLTRPHSDQTWLILIISIAILGRVGIALALGNNVTDQPGIFDQLSYDMLAQQVIAGQGFTVAEDWWPATPAGEPTAHWSYLYTLYLSAVYSVFGYNPLVARVIQAIAAGILMPWLLYRLGRSYFSANVGLIAAGLSAGYIYFAYYAGALMTETFYIISILWVLERTAALTNNIEAESGGFDRRWLQFGLALAITALLRQVFVLFAPLLFLWIWAYRTYRRRDTFLPTFAGLFAAGLILIGAIAPWSIRNYRAFDTFVLLNTNAGFAFYWGNHPIHGYNFIDILTDGTSYYSLIPPELLNLNEAKLDKALMDEAMTIIRTDPLRYIVLSLSRTKDYFKFWPAADSSTLSNLSRVLSFGILLPFMAYGFFSRLRHSWNTPYLVLYLFAFVYTGVHLLSWALIRYRLPIDAILLLFAGLAMVDLVRYIQTQRQPALTTTTLPSSQR